MTVYIIYFFLMPIVLSICSAIIENKNKAQTMALKILMFLMYLILALKAESVGCDISGYKEVYDYTKTVPFNDFSYLTMESGYLLLMKVFNILGYSFQGFAAFLYAISLIPLYFLIKKYSPDVMMSVMILFCLDFFVFACSGLRQTLAMSLCVWAFLVLTGSNKKRKLIIVVLIIVTASFIHRSAILFLPALFIIFFRSKKVIIILYAAVLTFVLLNRDLAISLNQQYELSRYEYDERLTLGPKFVFYVIMFVFYVISIRVNRPSYYDKLMTWQLGSILPYGLILMIAFSGSMLLRSSIYELLFLSVILPIAINSWQKQTRQLVSIVYIVVLFFLLYYLILKPSTLSIVPYKFFFQT